MVVATRITCGVVVRSGGTYTGIVRMYAQGSYYATRFPQVNGVCLWLLYIRSPEYEKEIVPGFTELLMGELDAIGEDVSVNVNSALKLMKDALHYDVSKTDYYDILLAQLMLNDENYEGIKDVFAVNLNSNVQNMVSTITNNLMSKASVSASDKGSLAGILDKFNKAEFMSSDYNTSYSDIMDMYDKYSTVGEVLGMISNSSLPVSDTIKTTMGSVAFETARDTVEFAAKAQTYLDTSEVFKDTLIHMRNALGELRNIVIGPDVSKDLLTELTLLENAINSYIDNININTETNTINLGNFATTAFLKNEVNSFANLFADTMAKSLPFVNALSYLKNGLTVTDFLALFDDNGDRTISGNMVFEYFYLAAALDRVANELEPTILSETLDKSVQFEYTRIFDEAISLYRTSTKLACEYASAYEDNIINKSAKILSEIPSWHEFPVLDTSIYAEAMNDGSGASARKAIVSLQKDLANNIVCHSEGLIFHDDTKVMELDTSKLNIMLIACPVTVRVYDADGSLVSTLDNNAKSAEGYQPYFSTVRIKGNDYMKTVAVPDGYTVKLDGTGNGYMDVITSTYHAESRELDNLNMYRNISVTNDTNGTIEQNGFSWDLVVDGQTLTPNDPNPPTDNDDTANSDDSYGNDSTSNAVRIYRLYNRWSHEHLYTSSLYEYNKLAGIGWGQEGEAWRAPESSSTPVYRLYNPYNGDHYYTTNAKELQGLVSLGWKEDDTLCYSDDVNEGVPVYQLFNPYELVSTHLYTTDQNEYGRLRSLGWNQDGVVWYGLATEDTGDTSVPPAGGQEDSVTYNGHRYRRIDESMTWTDARTYCENLGGHLATITSAGEQSAIQSLVSKGAKKQYWLGGLRTGSERGDWSWITGEPWGYTNWSVGEPWFDEEIEFYLEMYRLENPVIPDPEALGKWNDASIDNHVEAKGEEGFFSLGQVGILCEWDHE